MVSENKNVKNVLWGAGDNGLSVLLTLAVLGIYVDMFCDCDRKKQGLKLCNKMIVAPETILNNNSEYRIIISVDSDDNLRDIVDMLNNSGMKNYIRWRDIKGAFVIWSSKLIRSLHKQHVYNMIRDSYSRKLIIYGGKEEAEELRHLLSMLDIRIEYLVDNIEEEYDQGEYVVKPIFDLLDEDEDSFKVIVTSDREDNFNLLNQMGLKRGKDYSPASLYGYVADRKCILDTNLGYSFSAKGNNSIPGFIELGTPSGRMIVLLGGSTTDELLYPFRSWGCCLAEQFKQNGYNVRILNGGCRGYKTSQELIKLIRDVIPMRPDIIVDYTGVNDIPITLVRHEKGMYPFIHQYQKDMFEQISREGIYDNTGRVTNSDEFTMGMSDERPVWNRFADNIKMMDSICRCTGIVYKAFLQPCLITKRKNRNDRELYLHLGFSDQNMEAVATFYENARRIKPDCMEDITGLFDDENDVYLDICHVTEHGNEMIAQYIYEYLTEKGLIRK